MGGQCSSASSYLAAKEMQAVASSCHSDRAMSRLLRILSRKSTEAWIVEPPRLNWSPTSDCSIGMVLVLVSVHCVLECMGVMERGKCFENVLKVFLTLR